jgi:hypothetical protein
MPVQAGRVTLPATITPDLWLRQLFSAQAARDGGVVRRSVRDVERIVGRIAFEQELRRRGFCAVENAGQFVIFCNRAPIRLIR